MSGSTEEKVALSGLTDRVREALKAVIDPEVGYNIVELGLVYDVVVDDAGYASVRMTLTSPMCPMGPQIINAAKAAVTTVEGISAAEIELVWSPPWDPRQHASDDIKAALGIWD